MPDQAADLTGFGPNAPSFEGDSKDLERTRIVPVLDTAMEQGKNLVWCATFLAAWKRIQQDPVGGPVQMRGAEEICDDLNTAPDPIPDLPAGSYCAAAGFVNDGIVETIFQEMQRLFPQRPLPSFPGIPPNWFLAYGYLQAYLRFSIPYFESRELLSFVDSAGNVSEVHSFGIREQDGFAYYGLRNQIDILYTERSAVHGREVLEFALDLCRSSPDIQIVLARVEPKESLEAMVASLEEKIARPGKEAWRSHFGPNDILLVPNLFWRIKHRFAELERRRFANETLAGLRIDSALQEIEFRLDRSGAELTSEARLVASSQPNYFLFDRPYLIYMKKRGAMRPFFVMWVDNAELLQTWSE